MYSCYLLDTPNLTGGWSLGRKVEMMLLTINLNRGALFVLCGIFSDHSGKVWVYTFTIQVLVFF